MDSAEDYLSGARQAEHQSATGDALKNRAYGVDGWYVKSTSRLARERFRYFKNNVRTVIPAWDEKFTLLLLSEAVMEPRSHLPGVKALEVPFNTILRMNFRELAIKRVPEAADFDLKWIMNRPAKVMEKSMGVRLVGLGVSGDQDETIRQELRTTNNGTYDEPTVVGGRRGPNVGARA